MASFLYKLMYPFAQFVVLRLRADIDKDVEIVALRDQPAVLHRQNGKLQVPKARRILFGTSPPAGNPHGGGRLTQPAEAAEARQVRESWLRKKAARLGHEMAGIAATYSHVSDQMREELKRALQARWEAALDQCLALHPRSPVAIPDELLAARAGRTIEDDLPNISHKGRDPILLVGEQGL
jgi:hypothetical protein